MRFLSLALGGLLLSTALPALAQTSTETPALPGTTLPGTTTPLPPRYYIGLGAYSSFYQSLGHASEGSYDYNFRLPVQLTAGYQLSPRLAVQLGVAYSAANYRYDQFLLNTTPGQPASYNSMAGSKKQQQTSVSALARYTITANPAHRLQFDALGGATFERGTAYYQGSRTDNAQGPLTTTNYDYHVSQNTWLLTGGVGARYRLSRHFELTYDFMVNKALNDTNRYGSGLTNTLTTSQALGLRYRFGR
ncbi:hypothetical protein GCM10028824_00900 [Hymenobacter segetis]|uniref:Outer membrane beta-barrel protein n=1 Tax=Hymenobacter segetis TaxID=2025509 RepID=A0ABU9LSW8_9BACT